MNIEISVQTSVSCCCLQNAVCGKLSEVFINLHCTVEYYRSTKTLPLTGSIKEQLNRASLSIPLNLSEGRSRATIKEQKRFFNIALGSLRESQTILLIENLENTAQYRLLDKLAAHLYKLIQNAS
ncbi:MAG: four helix bundle protein [Proteobacteria bacterium]|nr:four helix bundle protein [Pseudomonadota bacterium]